MLAHFDYSHPRKGLSTHICKLVLYCHLPAKKKRPAGGGAQASLAYRVPVTVRVLEPGAVVQTPVVLRIRGGGNRHLSGHGGETAGGRVIGVIRPGSPCGSVEGDGEILQNRVEHVGDDRRIRFFRGFIAVVLDQERIGELPILGHRRGCERLTDAQAWFAGGVDRGRGSHGGGQALAGNGRPVDDRVLHGPGRIIIGMDLIDQQCVSSGGQFMFSDFLWVLALCLGTYLWFRRSDLK